MVRSALKGASRTMPVEFVYPRPALAGPNPPEQVWVASRLDRLGVPLLDSRWSLSSGRALRGPGGGSERREDKPCLNLRSFPRKRESRSGMPKRFDLSATRATAGRRHLDSSAILREGRFAASSG